jgi:hypothetical protein
MAAEKAEQERMVVEKAEQERMAAEKAEQERMATDKAGTEPEPQPQHTPGSMEDLMQQLAQGWGGSRSQRPAQPQNTTTGKQRQDEKFKEEQKALGLLSSSDDDDDQEAKIDDTEDTMPQQSAPLVATQLDVDTTAKTADDQIKSDQVADVSKCEQKILSESDMEVEVEVGGDEFLCDKESEAVFALADPEAQEVGRWDATARRIIFFEAPDAPSSVPIATDTDEASEDDDGVASDTDEGTDDDRSGPPPLGKMGTKASLPRARAKGTKPRRGPPPVGQAKAEPPPQRTNPPAVASAPVTAKQESFEALTNADPFAEIEAMASGGATTTSNSSQISGGDDPFAELAAMALINPSGAGSENDPFAELQALVS